MGKIVAAALCVAVLAACDRQPEPPMADTAAIAAGLRTEEQAMKANIKARDAAAWASHYSADATFMVPFEAAMSGQDKIKANLARYLSDPAFNLEFSSDATRTAESGDMAYTRGRFTVTQTDPRTKKPVSMSGNYLTIFRKQADGSWKAVEDIASPGASAGSTPPEP